MEIRVHTQEVGFGITDRIAPPRRHPANHVTALSFEPVDHLRAGGGISGPVRETHPPNADNRLAILDRISGGIGDVYLGEHIVRPVCLDLGGKTVPAADVVHDVELAVVRLRRAPNFQCHSISSRPFATEWTEPLQGSRVTLVLLPPARTCFN